MEWFDLLAVQGPLKSLLQHHSSKASILQPSDFFIVQFSHPYMFGFAFPQSRACEKALGWASRCGRCSQVGQGGEQGEEG